MPEEALYTIGKLAEAANTTPRAIRYYTAEGLLPPPLTAGRYARYSDSQRNRLRLIQRLKNAYLPLAAIRTQIAALTDAQIESLLAESAKLPDTNPDEGPNEPLNQKNVRLQIQTTKPHSEQSGEAYVAQILAVTGQIQRTQSEVGETAKTEKPRRALLVSPVFRPAEAEETKLEVREIWERIPLSADAELQIRIPDSLERRERLERLIDATRTLFAEIANEKNGEDETR